MGYARRLLWFQRELATAPAASAAGLALTLYTFGELFAGTRAWSQGLEMLDFVGKSFDAIYTVSDESICHIDFLTPVGFLRVLAHILAMHRGGVFLAAIPCNSWVFFSRNSTGRHLAILGNDSSALVRAHNALVARVVYLLILCIKRGVFWIVEQPWTSIVWNHPRWQYLEKRFGEHIVYVEHDMGAYTLDVVKKSVFVGTAPYIKDLGTVLTPEGRRLVLNNPIKKQTGVRCIDGEGVSRSKGGKDLKKTEHYAMAFGCRHANLYDSTCNSYAEAGEPGYDIRSDASTDSEIGDEEWCFEDFKNNPDCYKLDDTSVTKSSLKKRKHRTL